MYICKIIINLYSIPVPKPPTSLRATISSNDIYISWMPPVEGEVKQYLLFNEVLSLNTKLTAPIMSHTLPSLMDQSVYNISILAVYDLPSIPAVLQVHTGGKHL